MLLTCAPASEDTKPSAKNRDIFAEIDSLNSHTDKTVDSILLLLSNGADTVLSKDQIINIHLVLQKIIDEKASALAKLDDINDNMNSIEEKVEEYVKKKKVSAAAELKRKLLQDIQRLKAQLNEIKPRTLNEVVQKPIPNYLKSLKELPTGNYKARIDRTHVLQFFIDENGEIFVSPLIRDSTTIFTGAPINPKVAEQIQKIRESLKNN